MIYLGKLGEVLESRVHENDVAIFTSLVSHLRR
jgi:hypothetical protein